VLGVARDADEASLRAAYLALIQQHPPETAPEMFEAIRDAYAAARDPRWRAQSLLEADPLEPFVHWLDTVPADRRFVGPKPWLKVIAEAKQH
jgi:hypothetical protein